jgi:hypothetical protein
LRRRADQGTGRQQKYRDGVNEAADARRARRWTFCKI